MMLNNRAGKDESFTLPRRHGGSYHHTRRKNTDDFGDDGAGSQDSSTEYTLLDDASGFNHTVRACPAEAAHEASEAISALKNMCEQLHDQLREAEVIQTLREQEHAVEIRETENRMAKHIMSLEDALDTERAESSRLRKAPLGSSRRRASVDGGALGSSRGWRSQEQQLLDDRIRTQESSLRSLKSDVAILRRRLRTQAETIEKQKEENDALRRTAKNVARIEDDEITMLASDLDAAILEAETEAQKRRYLEHRLLITEKRLQKWRTAAIGVNEFNGANGGDNEDDGGSHGRTLPLSGSSFDGDGDGEGDEEMRHGNPDRSEISEIHSCRRDGRQSIRRREERGEVEQRQEHNIEVISRSSGTAISAGQRRPGVVLHARAKLSPDPREDRGTDGTRSCGGSPKAHPSPRKGAVDTRSSNRAGRCSRGETKSSANGVFENTVSRRNRIRGKTTPERRRSACREMKERSSRAPDVRPSPDRCDVLGEEDTRTTHHSPLQDDVRLDETEVAIFVASPLVERTGSAKTTVLSDELGDDDVCTPRLGSTRGCGVVPVSAAHMSAARRGARWSAAIADELRSAVIPAYSSSPVSPSSVANFPEEKAHETDFKSDKGETGRSPYVPGTFGVADSPLGSGRTRVAAAELLGRLAFSRGV